MGAIAARCSAVVAIRMAWKKLKAARSDLELDVRTSAYDLYGHVSSWSPARTQSRFKVPEGSVERLVLTMTNLGRSPVTIEAPQLELLKSRASGTRWGRST